MFNVYGIFCKTTWKVYYGKTNLTVEERLELHEKAYRGYLKEYADYCTSFEILKNNNYEIKLLEVCDDNLHMKIREGYYIRTFPCVNKLIPGRTKKEYYEDNREKIKEYGKEYREANKEKMKGYYEDNKEKISEKAKKYRENNREKILEKAKEYYEDNKEKILEKRKQKYTCACGSTLTIHYKAKHEKTNKHQKYLQSL